jgi:deoxyribose-phosphate aldolase
MREGLFYVCFCLQNTMTDLAAAIEHTLLRPDTTLQDVRRLCEEATQYKFAGVCVPPFFVRDARRLLGDQSRVRVVTVVGFPMGYTGIAAKSEEIRRAADDGADDVDAVINIAALKSGNWNHVSHDIESVARAAHLRGKTLKLILECGLLSAEEIQKVCEIAQGAQVGWLKTSTGMHGIASTADMVRQLRAMAAPPMKIKASGGIRDAQLARELIAAGADRLGCSASLHIIGAGA